MRRDAYGTILGTTEKAPHGYGRCPVCRHPNVHRRADGALGVHGSIEAGGMCSWRPCEHPMHDADCGEQCENPEARCPECKGDGFFDALEGGNEHTTRDCGACGGSGMREVRP